MEYGIHTDQSEQIAVVLSSSSQGPPCGQTGPFFAATRKGHIRPKATVELLCFQHQTGAHPASKNCLGYRLTEIFCNGVPSKRPNTWRLLIRCRRQTEMGAKRSAEAGQTGVAERSRSFCNRRSFEVSNSWAIHMCSIHQITKFGSIRAELILKASCIGAQ